MNEKIRKWVFEFGKCDNEFDAYDLVAKIIIDSYDNEELYNVAVDHVNDCLNYASQLDNKNFS